MNDEARMTNGVLMHDGDLGPKFYLEEARETKYWLRMVAKADVNSADGARILWQEAKELHLIFADLPQMTMKIEANIWSLVISHSFVIRASSFVIRHLSPFYLSTGNL